ncbi:hypothetical protein [Labrenzia sp. PHM005]|uniref:hypothetical protein n=1 Tax=Labrenzia sp. PHM005 TaxID=2590016 RepID=UPI0011406A8E|nr:hypothetical protein [Labrenzia sp. PHM005]QDG77615.1 hypothetical protein FJ695_18050 [Labrenzia sp. PHM005]
MISALKMGGIKHIWAIVPILMLGLVSTSKADWINLTGAEVAPNIAEIYVADDGVTIALEIFVNDLEEFAALIPDAWYKDPGQISVSEDKRLADFGQNVLSVIASGQKLPVELRTIDRRFRKERASPYAGTIDPYSGRRFPAPPKDKRVVFAELFYPFSDGLPDTVEFVPPQGEEGLPKTSIGMIVFHDEVPVIDFRYFSGPATLTLDRNDPWFSKFDNASLTRHHRYPRMSFLYAEPYEVRHEALIRVRDAAELAGLKPAGPILEETEKKELTTKIASLIAEQSPMSIDGKGVVPDFDRAAFMRIGLRGLEILAPSDPVNVDAAILGLIWSAPTDGLPKEATVQWTLYDENASQVPGYAIDAAGPFLYSLTQDDPKMVWTNHFKKSPVPAVETVEARPWTDIELPGLSIVFWLSALGLGIGSFVINGRLKRSSAAFAAVAAVAIGFLVLKSAPISVPRPGLIPADLPAEQAQNLTQQLLSNVYRSFDFRGEAQVYDRLAKTIDGQLLEEVYLDQRQALRIAKAGGADARVKSVNVSSAVPEHIGGTAADFKIRTKWTIVGTVGHWGHIHQRVNSYDADLLISPEEGAWKIIGFEVHEQERLS